MVYEFVCALQADALLSEEMAVVKNAMGHFDLTEDSYSKIWEECYHEVLFLPSQNRYTSIQVHLYNIIFTVNIPQVHTSFHGIKQRSTRSL